MSEYFELKSAIPPQTHLNLCVTINFVCPQVTIAGSSAGAQSVMFHLMSETSSTLFQQAIMQSQPAFFQYASTEDSLMDTTAQLLNITGCADVGVECLRYCIS